MTSTNSISGSGVLSILCQIAPKLLPDELKGNRQIERRLQLYNEVEELREDIPLKRSGIKTYSFWNCLQYRNVDCLTGIGLVYTVFTTISISVTFLLMVQIYYGAHQISPHGNVVTDNAECSSIGTLLLKKGGNAVDAAIAAAICMAVVNPHTTGLAAGGIFMTYNHRTRTLPEVVNFGPTVQLDTTSLPRLIIGLSFAHRLYGKLPWLVIVKPSVDLARNGFIVQKTLSTAIEMSRAFDLYGTPLPGQRMELTTLAYTLELYANITSEQFDNLIDPSNEPSKEFAINTTFENYNIYVPNSPTIGPVLLTNLNNIKKYNFTKEDTIKPEYMYRLAEIILNTYAELNITKRLYEVTASVVTATDMHDSYVSIVTGLNGMLGSSHMNPAGFIIDNAPVVTGDLETSFMPVIITDSKFICGKRIIFGTGDASLAVQIISELLIAEQNLTESIEASRFRILGEKEIGIEEHFISNFTDDIMTYLQTIGNLTSLSEPYDGINSILLFGDNSDLHSDSRTGGLPSQL